MQHSTSKYKTVTTIIGRTDLRNEELVAKKGTALTKHLVKILKIISILKEPRYRFRNNPTEINSDLLELLKLIYKESIRNITSQEKQDFETLYS